MSIDDNHNILKQRNVPTPVKGSQRRRVPPPAPTSKIQQAWEYGWDMFSRTVLAICIYLGIWHYFFRPFYVLLNYMHNSGVAPLKFMNYGYVEQNEEDKRALAGIQATLETEPKIEHTYIRLYEKIFSLCPWYPSKLEGKDFFEVSCGHMGGLDWFAKAHPELKSVRGLDFAPADPDDPRVIQGDAQAMPVADNSVDIIINVEATHAYGKEFEFYKECMRILRPGGYLLWTDFRIVGYYEDMVYERMREAGLDIVVQADITDGVLAALDIQTDRVKGYMQKKWYTRCMTTMWNAFWGVPGTAVYRDMASGKYVYAACACQKPVDK